MNWYSMEKIVLIFLHQRWLGLAVMGKYHSELLMLFNLAFLMKCKYLYNVHSYLCLYLLHVNVHVQKYMQGCSFIFKIYLCMYWVTSIKSVSFYVILWKLWWKKTLIWCLTKPSKYTLEGTWSSILSFDIVN